MPIAIILYLIALLTASPFDCGSALTHQHDRLRDAEIVVSSWSGCTVNGTINGAPVALFMDVPGCALRAKVPGKLRARYDQTCGAILEITDGPAITTPMPAACQTPTLTPTPVVVESKGPIITDTTGARWTLGPERQTLRNGVHVGAGAGTIYKLSSSVVYVLGNDSNWYRWTGSSWAMFGAQEPGGLLPSPTPTPTPTPSPTPTATPTPSPSPSPSPEAVDVVFKAWPSSEPARRKLISDMALQGYKFCGAFNSSACFVKE